jgi:hypothetical protein
MWSSLSMAVVLFFISLIIAWSLTFLYLKKYIQKIECIYLILVIGLFYVVI